MPSKPKPTRHVRQVTEGCIRPDCIYTSEGCMIHFGMGHGSLDEARQSGMVTPIEHGRRHYYAGDELIAWLRSKQVKGPQA